MKRLFFLVFSLVTAACLRFYNIKEKGVCETDAAIYVQEAAWFESGARACFSFLKEKKPSENLLKEIQEQTKGIPLQHPKPLHSLVIAALGFVTGGVKDYTGNMLSAIFGTICCLLIFFFCKEIFGEKIAILSSFILASSPLHLLYSREAFSEIDTLFFLILASYFYIKVRKKSNLLLAGIFLGLSFLTHYRAAFFIALFLIYELLYQIIKKRFSPSHFLLLFLPTLGFFFLFEAPYRIVLLLYKEAGKAIPFKTYWEVLAKEVMLHKGVYGVVNKGMDILCYPFFFLFSEGVFSILSIIAAILLLKKLDYKKGFLLFFFFFFFLFLTFKTLPESNIRIISPIVFPAAIFSASFLMHKKRVFLIFPALLYSFYHNINILKIHSGFRDACSYLKEELRTSKHLTTSGWLSNLYMDFNYKDVEVFKYHYTLEDIEAFFKKGYRYLLIDARRFFLKPKIKEGRLSPSLKIERPCLPPQSLRMITKAISPMYIAKDTRALYPWYWWERGADPFYALAFFLRTSKDEKYGVYIYDLKMLFKK